MNKYFAVAFTTIGTLALFGAMFCDAPWHYATALLSGIIAALFFAEDKNQQAPGVQGR